MKADVKYRVACHGGEDNDHVECPNLDIPHLRLQKCLQVRDKNDDAESSKRQRKEKRWEKMESKGVYW